MRAIENDIQVDSLMVEEPPTNQELKSLWEGGSSVKMMSADQEAIAGLSLRLPLPFELDDIPPKMPT